MHEAHLTYRLRAKKGPAPQGIVQTYPILKKISSK